MKGCLDSLDREIILYFKGTGSIRSVGGARWCSFFGRNAVGFV